MKLWEHCGPSAARILLAVIFVVLGLAKLSGPSQIAAYIASKGLPVPMALAVGAGSLEVVAGLMLLFGFQPRAGALALAVYLIPVTLIFHNPAGLAGMEAQAETINLMKNLAIIGGLLAAAGQACSPNSPRAAAPRLGTSGFISSPVLRLLGYYGLLFAVLVVLKTFVPFVEGTALPGSGAEEWLSGSSTTVAALIVPPRLALLTTLSMTAALALMLPVAWVYRLTKPHEGYEPSVVETLIILPVAVAAIVRMVQNSLPLAFSLAGIVAAVRFRNTLKDSKDTVFVFVAIGLGLAAGVQALTVAAVMSLIFSAVVLTLWHVNVGGRAPLAGVPGARRLGGALLLPFVSPERVARPEMSWPPAEARGRKWPRALLVVRPVHGEPAWRPVEEALKKHAKTWRLLEVLPGSNGDAPLEYRVRLRRNSSPAMLLEEVRRRAGREILGVELKPLRQGNATG